MIEKPADDPQDTLEEFVSIKLSKRDLQDAARILASLVGEAPSKFDGSGDTGSKPARQLMVQRARTTLRNRRRRSQIFGPSLFGEPGWDILLSLYITEAMGPRNTVGRLVAFSGVSQTTALRWLDVLEANNLIERKSHPTDKRTVMISLSAAGLAGLDAYFSETLARGV